MYLFISFYFYFYFRNLVFLNKNLKQFKKNESKIENTSLFIY